MLNLYIQKSDFMKKIRTGIYGLDEMLNGGIPLNHHVALCAGPGGGKTTFSFEFLYRGAKMGEKGLYLTLEEVPEELIENIKNTFSNIKDIDAGVKLGYIHVVKPDKLDIETIGDIVQDYVLNHDVKRVVIDSATMIKYSLRDPNEYRQTLFSFFELLKALDCTILLLIENESQNREDQKYSLEQFVMDGVIYLYNIESNGKRVRVLEIFKMRGTKHSRELVPFKITPSGIEVYKEDKVF